MTPELGDEGAIDPAFGLLNRARRIDHRRCAAGQTRGHPGLGVHPLAGIGGIETSVDETGDLVGVRGT